MTEREKRNEEMKSRIRQDAETHCQFIDLLESELKQREAMAKDLSEALDKAHGKSKAA